MKPDYKILNNKTDFHWHKKELDLRRKYEHDHDGEPEEYPCGVESEFFDNPNGPYEYLHEFIYQQEVVCRECGHKTIIWPEQA